MEIIADSDTQLVLLKKTNADRDAIIENKNQENKELTHALKIEHRKKNWTKVGWISSVVVLVVLLVMKP